ncbi:MAG: transcriptional repressor LexA [Gammaproteobacteria bacterium]
MIPLTTRQQAVLEFIVRYLGEQGMPPSRANIAAALGFQSPNAAEIHLKALARKGYIELLPGRNRNIRLLAGTPREERGIPLVGRIAAGSPILAVENIESYHQCGDLFRPSADYLLRVQGMSMRDAGIHEGDLLAVHRTPDARDGQIVVARLDDEATVKRLERLGKRIRLLPANADFSPIEVDLNRHTLVIEGIGVGVIRSVR